MTGSKRADALVAAAETLDALQIEQAFVIDPFAAIDRIGLTLSITKLGNLLGAVVPRGTGGVLVTSERSPAIQRYTAAHEIGHWILHEAQLQVDGEDEVLGRPSNEMEREAQLFAGYFLMPPTLLNNAISAYGLQAGRVAPEQVYRISRDLDVSFEAAARRLHVDRLLNNAELREILEFGRMQAMRRASAGHRPAFGLADVWDATSDDDAVSLVVEEKDEVLVNLPEQRLAGWRWQTAEELDERSGQATPRPRPVAPRPLTLNQNRSPDRAHLPALGHGLDVRAANTTKATLGVVDDAADASAAVLADDVFMATGPSERPKQRQRRRRARAASAAPVDPSLARNAVEPNVGGNGTRTLVVRTASPGDWNLQLFYAHAYDPRAEPLLTYELQLSIQPTPNSTFRAQRLDSALDERWPGDPDDDVEFEVA